MKSGLKMNQLVFDCEWSMNAEKNIYDSVTFVFL